MPKEIGEEIWKLVNGIWKGEGVSGDWNKEVISLIYKRGKRNELKNYRKITLIDTAYKIYANILYKKLEKKRKKETQEEEKKQFLGEEEEQCSIHFKLCCK